MGFSSSGAFLAISVLFHNACDIINGCCIELAAMWDWWRAECSCSSVLSLSIMDQTVVEEWYLSLDTLTHSSCDRSLLRNALHVCHVIWLTVMISDACSIACYSVVDCVWTRLLWCVYQSVWPCPANKINSYLTPLFVSYWCCSYFAYPF